MKRRNLCRRRWRKIRENMKMTFWDGRKEEEETGELKKAYKYRKWQEWIMCEDLERLLQEEEEMLRRPENVGGREEEWREEWKHWKKRDRKRKTEKRKKMEERKVEGERWGGRWEYMGKGRKSRGRKDEEEEGRRKNEKKRSMWELSPYWKESMIKNW